MSTETSEVETDFDDEKTNCEQISKDLKLSKLNTVFTMAKALSSTAWHHFFASVKHNPNLVVLADTFQKCPDKA